MGATLSTGISGSSELVYNMRLASIKSLFASFVGQTAGKTINGIFDSVDPTTNTSTTSGGLYIILLELVFLQDLFQH